MQNLLITLRFCIMSCWIIYNDIERVTACGNLLSYELCRGLQKEINIIITADQVA